MKQPEIRARRIGREGTPIVVIDGFSQDPEALRDLARDRSFVTAADHYPGVRAVVPADYMSAHGPILAPVLKEVFGGTGSVRVLDMVYGIVSTSPTDLTLVQRLPHVDAMSPDRIALVHYLTPGRSEGTAFFRHRVTGFESIDPARGEAYLAALNAEAQEGRVPKEGYVSADTDLFECIHVVEARFNRAVVYRSNMLHSGAITADTPLSPDPVRGRLTITGFLSLS
ncbi:hypothetical protein BZG35_16765 [Brevundimonas sp. LM2]|uniref:DUF6445 family protein n=1 Tax=Brevundimonas sp. LM2 TaxID=1938605 RepID=UPI000983EA0A|nr:DUF6445 family protein [Brevundimonas sp. LM2]AQR63117.1 hypothetical protein BZG35_16765 [Brevundimonas sp. LM2]